MDLIILDKDFANPEILDNYTSLQWSNAHYTSGSFELHCTTNRYDILQVNKHVYRKDDNQTGLIESIEVYSDQQGVEMVRAKGRFLDCLLEDRVIDNVYNYNGTAEQVMRDIVETLCITPLDRKIHKLALGNINGVGSVIQGQVTGKNLLEFLQTIMTEQEISHKITYDFEDDTLQYEVFKGLDRTENQTGNNMALFSKNFENVLSENYIKNVQGSANVAIVAGSGEGEARIKTVVDLSNGQKRKELYVDARDIQQGDLSTAEYNTALHDRGLQKLAETRVIESIVIDVDTTGNLIYKEDYSIGDICTVVFSSLSLYADQRIVEILEIFENTHQIKINFGKEPVTIKQYIDRRSF